uniref:Uncharacterized protein n=1 Tax=Oryctolagus cuniculus TaxID=9986 RepID=A0A5F9D788_RABIT
MVLTLAAFCYMLLLLPLPHSSLPSEYLVHTCFCVVFLCEAEWLILGLDIPFLAFNIWRYMSRPVMSGPGLYDPTTIMNADILTFFFLLPIWHGVCFDELLEQHTKELVQFSAVHAKVTTRMDSFQQDPVCRSSLSKLISYLKSDSLFFKMFPHCWLVERLFSYVTLG